MMTEGAPIYFDNAASTPLRPAVRDYFFELLQGPYANPSSGHAYGRKAKALLEDSRRRIAQLLSCEPAEIVFTSGGSESDNAAIFMALNDLGCRRIITAPTEHHAVLHAAERWCKAFGAECKLLSVDQNGAVDLGELEILLADETPSLVSLMHGNNEIGNLLDLESLGALCRRYGAFFHSDTVQTVGHFPLALGTGPLDFAAASAHKFHGPKGVGFLYRRKTLKTAAFITGGSQERGLRGGTENIAAVGAMALALELAYENLAAERAHILALKRQLSAALQEQLPGVLFNGLCGQMDRSLYSVLSARFPQLADDSMLLFSLDLAGVAVSGGSACASGAVQGSHVIRALYPTNRAPVIRFSFGKDNTPEEIDRVVQILRERASSIPKK